MDNMNEVLQNLMGVRETLEDVLAEYPDSGDETIYTRIENLADIAEGVSDTIAQNLEG